MIEERGKGTPKAERGRAVLSREFNSPRQKVFDLLTDPNKGAVAWSPEEAVNLVFELDPKPGGAIRIQDRDADGHVASTTGTVVEIAAPELLIVRTRTTPPGGTAPWEALQTLRFEELGPRRTRVTVEVSVLATGSFPGGAESLRAGYRGGWGEVLDRLQRKLA